MFEVIIAFKASNLKIEWHFTLSFYTGLKALEPQLQSKRLSLLEIVDSILALNLLEKSY